MHGRAAAMSALQGRQSRISARMSGRDSKALVEAAVAAEALRRRERVLRYEPPTPDLADYSLCAARAYIRLGLACRRLAGSRAFARFSVLLILLASLLVGIATYPALERAPATLLADQALLCAFGVEALVKALQHPTQPSYYLSCRNPAARWNWFDFSIIVLCLPLPGLGSLGVLPNVFRLFRVARLVEHFPNLRVISRGLLGGLYSIVSIVMLLLFVFYVYSIAGIFFFRANDPWHFGSFGATMVTLFRCATLEDWTNVMYINMYGCKDYADGFYQTRPAPTHPWPAGVDASSACNKPSAQPVLSAVYFISFIAVASLVILSMFIGAVTLSMQATLETIQAETLLAKARERVAKSKRKLRGSGSDQKVKKASFRQQNRELKVGSVLKQAWSGRPYPFEEVPDPRMANSAALRAYSRLGRGCRAVTTHGAFQGAVLAVIVAAGLLVGLETDDELMRAPAAAAFAASMAWAIPLLFTTEVGLKIVAEGLDPHRFFRSGWNTFDFLVVAVSLTPGLGNDRALMPLLRLVRLLLVLKMLKSQPTLRINVSALIMGLSSIGSIGVLCFLVFFFFAVCGVILFRQNDPWHFGNVHLALLTLFRCATLEDWTDVMYINMFGCDKYGYDAMLKKCVAPRALGYLAVAYFVLFTLIGALVLLNLFVGVITMNMEEAGAKYREEVALEARVAEVAALAELSEAQVELYRDVFGMLDLDGGGTISLEELRIGLNAAGLRPTEARLRSMMSAVDADDTGEVDFCEFVQFMLSAGEEKADVARKGAVSAWGRASAMGGGMPALLAAPRPSSLVDRALLLRKLELAEAGGRASLVVTRGASNSIAEADTEESSGEGEEGEEEEEGGEEEEEQEGGEEEEGGQHVASPIHGGGARAEEHQLSIQDVYESEDDVDSEGAPLITSGSNPMYGNQARRRRSKAGSSEV